MINHNIDILTLHPNGINNSHLVFSSNNINDYINSYKPVNCMMCATDPSADTYLIFFHIINTDFNKNIMECANIDINPDINILDINYYGMIPCDKTPDCYVGSNRAYTIIGPIYIHKSIPNSDITIDNQHWLMNHLFNPDDKKTVPLFVIIDNNINVSDIIHHNLDVTVDKVTVNETPANKPIDMTCNIQKYDNDAESIFIEHQNDIIEDFVITSVDDIDNLLKLYGIDKLFKTYGKDIYNLVNKYLK